MGYKNMKTNHFEISQLTVTLTIRANEDEEHLQPVLVRNIT
jgi:hypothetical protein